MLSDSDKNKKLPSPRKRTGLIYPDSVKMEALKLWLVVGNLRAVSASMNIPYITLQSWRYSDWWAEMSADIKNEGQIQLSNRLKQIAAKAMDVTLDRLENGDWVLNQKTGKMERKPVVMRDAHRVAESFVDRATKIDAKPIEEVVEQKVADRLIALAEQFSKFSQRKKDAVDAVYIEKTGEVDVCEQASDGEGMGSPHSEHEDSASEEGVEQPEETLNAVHDEWTPGLQEGSPLGEDQGATPA